MSGVHIPGPDELPNGPLRTLTESLHELYRAAGRPSLRQIAQAVNENDRFADTVSHEKVSAMLHGSGLPKWSKLEPVVITLAQRSTPQRTPSQEAQKFKMLWDAAATTHLPEPISVSTPPPSRLRSAFVLGGVTGETKSPDYEGAILNQFCRNLGATIAEADVDLVVCSPFPDSADFYALSGYLESGLGQSVHLHMPRHEVVERQYDQLQEVLGPDAVERIRIWHYPGPETGSRDALEQAWLLCQLMAMEKADVVITIGGKADKSASTILHLAQIRQKPVVPFTFLGGAAERIYLRRNWKSVYPWLDARKLTDKNAVVDAMAIADEMVTPRIHDSNIKAGPLRTVFISRARVDAEYARALEDYLPKIGLTVLFGEKTLPADRTVESAIEDAVLQSDLFIVLWSRAYAASRYCYDEIDLALQRYAVGELRLWIINLDGSDVVPPNARELPIVVARTPSRVLEVVRDLLAGTG